MGTLARLLAWLTAAVLVYLASAPPNDVALARRVAEEVARGPGARLDLDRIAPFEWDRVCTLQAYTNRAGAQRTLGQAWLYRWESQVSEGLTYLVFLDGRRVSGAAQLPDADGNFSSLGNACVGRRDAGFVVADETPDWQMPGLRNVYEVERLGR